MIDTATLQKLATNPEKVSVWSVRPFQIVSLLEMLEHRANLFYAATRVLTMLHSEIVAAIADPERGSDALPNVLETNRVRFLEKRLRSVCDDQFEYERVLERLTNLNGQEPRLQPLIGGPFTLGALKHQLDELIGEIARALGDAKFMMIPSYDAPYHDKPDLFGPLVAKRFPKANREITEAGNCYATGNYTASVFHFMRAAEHGLRALAKKLKVPFPATFELKTWDELIRDVERKTQKIINRPKTPQRSKDLVFFNGAAAQFRYLKDAWRNHVMHTREVYDEHLAMSVLVHMREFMQHLATRLKE